MPDTQTQPLGDQFTSPGVVKITQLSLHRKIGEDGINLIPYVFEIDLYEDIFSPTMTGTMLISDSLGLSSGFPLVGGESIQIEFHTPECTTTIRKKFTIYKLENKLINAAKAVYVLHLISDFAYMDNKVRVSRLLQGNAVKLIEDLLVKDLKVKLDELPFKYDDAEKGRNQLSFLAPNWSPITIINRLASLCTDPLSPSTNGDLSNYLFFEGSRGLNFWSLGSLTRQADGETPKDIGNEYFYDQNPNRERGMRDFKKEMQQIIELRIDKQFDMLDRFSTGLFKNQVIEFDILKKNVNILAPFDYLKSFDKMWKMNKFPINSPDMDTGDGKLTAHTSYNKSIADIDPSIYPVKNRISLALMNCVTLEAVINGRTDIEVGDQIYINMPAAVNGGEDNGDPIDQLISGNYVITAIQHRINEMKHQMILRISTDSYSIGVKK